MRHPTKGVELLNAFLGRGPHRVSSLLPGAHPSSGKEKAMVLRVNTNKRFLRGSRHCLSCSSLGFSGLDPAVPQIVSAIHFLAKASPAMFRCWLNTKAWSEGRDWLLTHPIAGEGECVPGRPRAGLPGGEDVWLSPLTGNRRQHLGPRHTTHSFFVMLFIAHSRAHSLSSMRIQTRFKNAFSTLHKGQDESFGFVSFTVWSSLNVIAWQLVCHV